MVHGDAAAFIRDGEAVEQTAGGGAGELERGLGAARSALVRRMVNGVAALVVVIWSAIWLPPMFAGPLAPSQLPPVVVAAVFAGLGRMVLSYPELAADADAYADAASRFYRHAQANPDDHAPCAMANVAIS